MLLVAIIGLIPFSNILGLIVTPTFKATVDFFEHRKMNYQHVSINNIGFAQAKNALVNIMSSYPLRVDQSQCREGTIINDNSTNVQIHFERFSQNVECSVTFFSQYEYNIYKIEITADDSEGYTYSYGKETQTLGVRLALSLLIILVVIVSVFWAKNRKKGLKTILVSNLPSALGLELIKKYGQGFIVEDEEILRAIKLDKNTEDEISVFTALSEKDVWKRLSFMEEKGVIFNINNIWNIDDDSILKKIPK